MENELARAMTTPVVVIAEDEYIRLRESDAWLAALEAAGVDNWSGISYARELYNEEN